MATLIEATHEGRATSLPPLPIFSRHSTLVTASQRRPPASRPAPEAGDEYESILGRPQWSDSTVLTVIALTSVGAVTLWVGIGVAMWCLLVA